MSASRPPDGPTFGQLSIIIPTHNEAEGIGALLTYLQQAAKESSPEIIVVDGHSTDATAVVAQAAGARVLRCPRQGRAAQLNYGAAHARGAILYFLHADTYPPPAFAGLIAGAVAQGSASGCFRLSFDHSHWFLRANAWFTRFNINAVRFGDQSLFVRRAVFEAAGGFGEHLLVLEDQEIVPRLRRHGRFRVLPASVTTSARKYLANGIFRLQAVFALLVLLYKLGVSQPQLARVYKWLVQ